jgi:hypothetical protein
MRNFVKFAMVLSFTAIALFSKAQGINFQGVARGANGTIIAGSKIALKLSILAKTIDGNAEYVEARNVLTNSQGIFSVVLGDSANYATLGNFKNISWKEGQKFLKVEMDPAAGTNYISMGTTQLQYVPYAFYSLGVDAENVNGVLPVSKGGTGVSTSSEIKSKLGVDKISGDLKDNIIIGPHAMEQDSISVGTIAIGRYALTKNALSGNMAVGHNALESNTTGGGNTAIGLGTLQKTVTASGNTAVGFNALRLSTTTGNTAVEIGSAQ